MMTRMRTGSLGGEVEHAGNAADEGGDAVATVDAAADVDPDAYPRRMLMRIPLTMVGEHAGGVHVVCEVRLLLPC